MIIKISPLDQANEYIERYTNYPIVKKHDAYCWGNRTAPMTNDGLLELCVIVRNKYQDIYRQLPDLKGN